MALGHKNEAIADFHAATAIADNMVHDDPDQAYDRLDQIRATTHLALALAVSGQCSEAGPLFQRTIEEWKTLREIGVLAPAELRQAETLAVAMQKCGAFDL